MLEEVKWYSLEGTQAISIRAGAGTLDQFFSTASHPWYPMEALSSSPFPTGESEHV